MKLYLVSYLLQEDESKECSSINISSGDVYQIFSYLHFYDCQNTAYLLVPKAEIKDIVTLNYQLHTVQTDKKIKIIPIDLQEVVKSHILNLDYFLLQSSSRNLRD